MILDNRASRANVLAIVFALLLAYPVQIIVVAVGEQCTRDECVEQAMRLTESIDESVNPCDDFVEFACGNQFRKFEQHGRRDTDQSSKPNPYFIKPTTYSRHLWWIRQRLKRELDQAYRIEEHRSIGLAKMYWQSCKITSAKEALVGVRVLFKRLGGWPVITEAWQDKHFTWDKFSKCSRLLGFLPRMFVHVGLNSDDVERPWYPNDTIELTLERSKYMYTREDMAKTMDRGFEYLKIAEYLTEKKKPDITDIEEALQFGKRIHLEFVAGSKDYSFLRKLDYSLCYRLSPLHMFHITLRRIDTPLHLPRFDVSANNDISLVLNRVSLPLKLTHSQEMPIVEQKVMSIGKLQKTYPYVNWMDYIRSMLTRRQANYLSDRNCVIVDVCYLSQIGHLLENTDKRVQANYAFLSIIDDLFLFIRPQLALTFAASQQEIEKICFDSVAAIFGKALEMMLATMVGQRMRLKVNEVQKNIAEQAHLIFHRIPWMDHQTQLQAAKKSQRTSFVNLFQDDIFEDRYFDRLEFTQPDATLVLFREVNVFLVDRYYLQIGRPRNFYILHRGENNTMFAIFKSPFSSTEASVRADRISNQVYIPAAAALHGRFSVVRELDYMNYATIGLQIANSMGHQIYQRGSFIDCNSNWRGASWWTKTTQRQFANRQTCVDVGAVKPLDEMSSIFGFIGAGEIAYKTMFDNPLNYCNTTLPGLKYTTRQLFWITAVASDCAKDLKRRYNMMVAHNSNFATDFDCPAGSNMNVTDKCKMWIV